MYGWPSIFTKNVYVTLCTPNCRHREVIVIDQKLYDDDVDILLCKALLIRRSQKIKTKTNKNTRTRTHKHRFIYN